MTEDEAIKKILDKACGEKTKPSLCNDSCMYREPNCAYLLAVDALKKQIAQPIEILNGQASCPNCKHLFGPMDVIKKLIVWDMKYCIDCGQKLDWSEEE